VGKDMLKDNQIHEEMSATLADTPNTIPSWDREALALKFQSIDGCTLGEARRQIDEMAQSFSQSARPRDRAKALIQEAIAVRRAVPRAR